MEMLDFRMVLAFRILAIITLRNHSLIKSKSILIKLISSIFSIMASKFKENNETKTSKINNMQFNKIFQTNTENWTQMFRPCSTKIVVYSATIKTA